MEINRENLNRIIEEKVNPLLATHSGGAAITKVEDGVVYVKLAGACATCPSAQSTMNDLVKDAIMENEPLVRDVVLDTSVSEDLLDMARKILNGDVR